MRKFLNLNNLCSIPSLSIQQAAFRGSKANKVNVYVLYAWQKLCEYFTNKIIITNSYDIEKLKTKTNANKIINLLEPIAMASILIIVTAYLVDNSYNPFLYFRF